MVIPLTFETAIHTVQLKFGSRYPFLRLDFFKLNNRGLPGAPNEINSFTLLKSAGLNREGDLVIEDNLTVKQLERTFEEGFGLRVLVSRRSGLLWLHTSLTNNWTLEKQNEHGREICLTVNQFPGKAADK